MAMRKPKPTGLSVVRQVRINDHARAPYSPRGAVKDVNKLAPRIRKIVLPAEPRSGSIWRLFLGSMAWGKH